MKDIATRARATYERHGFGIRLLATLAVVLGAGLGVGFVARSRMDEARDLSKRLERTSEVARRWRQEFVPATAAETDAWQRIRAEVAELGVRPGDRLTLAQVIARLAEARGLTNIRVSFAAPDSVAASAPRVVVTDTFPAAAYTLSLQASGSAYGLADVIEALPSAVEPRNVQMALTEQSRTVSCLLLVYEPKGGTPGA